MEQVFNDTRLGPVRFVDRHHDAHGVPVQPRDIRLVDVPAMHHSRLVVAIVTDIRVGAGQGIPKRLKLT